MLKRCSLVLAWMLAAPTACTCGEQRGKTLAAHSFRLPNGLEVELIAGPCAGRAAVVVLFGVGTNHDPPGRSGMAHLVERLLFTSVGAERLVQAGSDHTLYSVVVADEQVSSELDEVAARMARFDVTEADLGRARAHVLAEIASRRGGDASRMAMSYAAESIQPSRGNGWRGGIAAEVNAIQLAEVASFLRAHFGPGNARMIVVGRFDPMAVRARIEKAFAGLPAAAAPALRGPADSMVTGTLVMGDAPSAVAMAVPAPPPSAPLHPAFLILAARLMERTTETRGFQARYDPLAEPETLFVTGAVRPGERPEPAAVRIRSEMATLLAEPLTPSDLAAARDRFGLFLGLSAPNSLICAADPRGLAVARARRAQLQLGALPLGTMLDATTTEQLREAAALFAPTRTAAVIAGGTIR